jgi:hypothetical protein
LIQLKARHRLEVGGWPAATLGAAPLQITSASPCVERGDPSAACDVMRPGVASAGGNRAKQTAPCKAARDKSVVSAKSDDASGDDLSKELALLVVDVDHVVSPCQSRRRLRNKRRSDFDGHQRRLRAVAVEAEEIAADLAE